MSTAKVPVDIYASVAGGDLTHLGTVAVPVTSSKADDSLILNLKPQMGRLRRAMEYYRPADNEGEAAL